MPAPDRGGARDPHPCALLLLAAAVCAVCGCASVPRGSRPAAAAAPPQTQPSPTAIDYVFRIDEALSTLDGRACFHGPAPDDLVSGVHFGGDYMRHAEVTTSKGPRELPVVDHRIDLSGVSDDACVSYTVDLGAVASRFGGFDVSRHGDALVTNVALWLWRPTRWEAVGKLTARFELPAGMQASLPWPHQGDLYELDHSALAFYAFAVFGRFELEEVKAPGATLDVAILPGLPPSTRANVVPWLEQASRAAALSSGQFPRQGAQIVVIPTPPAKEAVRFGTTNRGGGASMALLLPVNAQLEPLLHDWVAVHEFCHLLHPFIERDDAWLSEGLATYYQEVLRVRAGMEAEQDAWRRLYEGSLLGRGAAHLSELSADMFANMSFKMVYWAGASFALMADVELRRRSHGQMTLDQVMGELAKSLPADPRPLRAREVVERLDRIVGA
ncbi:MAG: hypothetical protein ACHQ53_14240, partial [Polyangiales bacterium]